MDSYAIILAICLVGPVYCRRELERFIRTINGKSQVKCDADSICVMNNTNHLDNNEHSFCSTGGSNVSYVCLKKEYRYSNCTTLTDWMEIVHSGCYEGESEINFNFKRNKYAHLFVLHGSLQQWVSGPYKNLPAFVYYCRKKNNNHRWFKLKEYSRILIKLSDKDVVDFGEFFMEPPMDGKVEGKEIQENGEKIINRFLRTATDNWMKCPPNSYIVTKYSSHSKCNREQTCYEEKGFFNVQYLCVKNEFIKKNCVELTQHTRFDKDGCYLRNKQYEIELRFPKDSGKFFHVLLIRGTITYKDLNDNMEDVNPFYSYSCCPGCQGGCIMDAYENTWILVKISNNSKEDFRKFLMDNNPKPTTETKEKECYNGNGADYRGSISRTVWGTTCIKWTQSRKTNPSTHPNKGLGGHNYCRNPNDDSKPWCWVNQTDFSYCNMRKCSITTTAATAATTTTAAATTTATTTTMTHTTTGIKYTTTTPAPWPVKNVIIIVGAVIILLVFVIVLVAFVFYRRRRKSNPNIRHILKENETATNTIPFETTVRPTRGQEFNDETIYNSLYETTQSDVQSPIHSENQGSAQLTEVVYAEVNKKKDIKDDSAPGGASHVVVNDHTIYSDLFESTQSEVQSPIHSENQEPAQLTEDVYAVVNKKKDIKNDSAQGGPSHVEVNGDLYATVNIKGKEQLYANFGF